MSEQTNKNEEISIALAPGLHLIPTPIGNIQDVSPRVVQTLAAVDYLLAEDTRTSGQLMKLLEVSVQLRAYHAHNEHKVTEQIIKELAAGKTIGLVSDAGTPAISDPGFLLVRACVEHNIPVYCLPGPVAFIPALVKSGLPCNRFTFEGFLPIKKGRQKWLESLSEETRTMVFYESPHRIIKCIEQFITFFGPDRQASVSRELTKKFEETINGTLEEILESLTSKSTIKGEFVVVVGGKTDKKKNDRS